MIALNYSQSSMDRQQDKSNSKGEEQMSSEGPGMKGLGRFVRETATKIADTTRNLTQRIRDLTNRQRTQLPAAQQGPLIADDQPRGWRELKYEHDQNQLGTHLIRRALHHHG